MTKRTRENKRNNEKNANGDDDNMSEGAQRKKKREEKRKNERKKLRKDKAKFDIMSHMNVWKFFRQFESNCCCLCSCAHMRDHVCVLV